MLFFAPHCLWRNTSCNLRASLVAQMVKNSPAMQKTWVQSLGWEDPLEKGMANHSIILAWRIPWTEEPDQLQSIVSQRVRHDWATNTHNFRQPFPQRTTTKISVNLFIYSFSLLNLLMRKLGHREVKYWNLTKVAQLPNPGYHTALSRFYRLTWSQQDEIKYWEVNAVVIQWRVNFLLSRDLYEENSIWVTFQRMGKISTVGS